MCLKTAKNAVYGQILFGCCDVSLVILAHFPEFVVFVHSASQTFVVLGEFGGLLEQTYIASVFDVPFFLFPQERANVNEYLKSDRQCQQHYCRKPYPRGHKVVIFEHDAQCGGYHHPKGKRNVDILFQSDRNF